MKYHNLFQSMFMLFAMTVLLATIGFILAGREGLLIAAFVAATFMMFGRSQSTKWMLHAIGAVKLRPDQAPVLHEILAELSRRAGIERAPTLHLVEASTMLGFSTGTSSHDASIVLSSSLVQRLNAREIASVMAHEISHIASGDLAVMAMADTLTRMTRTLSLLGLFFLIFNVPMAATVGAQVPWGVVILLASAPLISYVMQMTLSRLREFEADEGAIGLSGDPEGLIGALEKLEIQNTGFLRHAYVPSHPETEPSLLRSHPMTVERVRRIAELEPGVEPLPSTLIGTQHGYPGSQDYGLGVPIRWLLRWWR
ncbi:zinc metalloprotease HtpX [Magnetovibrio sp. PR-2]|uniref:zinc metalloprotease HtpX n=1 Tax=Magnetovibrio sp. PR-2 TaxID=3120356 RepID=UPI002FCDF06B